MSETKMFSLGRSQDQMPEDSSVPARELHEPDLIDLSPNRHVAICMMVRIRSLPSRK